MWTRTPLSERLGIKFPIIQAPMASATSVDLVVAVSEAGGLGSYGGAQKTPDQLRAAIREIREKTDKPFNVNLFTYEAPSGDLNIEAAKKRLKPYYDELGLEPSDENTFAVGDMDDQLNVLIEEKIPVFSFTFGLPPEDAIRALKDNGTIIIGSATTESEGEIMAHHGIDIVVAQGAEAGGHRGTFALPVEDCMIGTMALVPQMVDVLDSLDVPVVAAGGIMDGRGVAAAMALGAAGVQLGTAFLSCPETGANKTYVESMQHLRDHGTMLTNAFSGRWARGIRNRYMEEMTGADEIAAFPAQYRLTAGLRKGAGEQNRAEFMSMLCSQAAGMSRIMGAGELVKTLANETEEVLARLSKE